MILTELDYPDQALGPLHAPLGRPLADGRLADDRPAGLFPAALSPDLVRRAQALARWRRRSEQIHFFRKALPAAIAAILLFGVGWIGIRAIISALAQADKELGSIHLINPTFYGRNEKGELYIMSAKEAVRAGDDPDRIALIDPDLKQYPVGAPAPMTTHAQHGLYHEQKKQLDLSDMSWRPTDGATRSRASSPTSTCQRNSVVGNTHVYSFGPSDRLRPTPTKCMTRASTPSSPAIQDPPGPTSPRLSPWLAR